MSNIVIIDSKDLDGVFGGDLRNLPGVPYECPGSLRMVWELECKCEYYNGCKEKQTVSEYSNSYEDCVAKANEQCTDFCAREDQRVIIGYRISSVIKCFQ